MQAKNSSVSLLCFTSKVSAAGLEVQTSDVITVVKNCIPYVIGMLAVIIIAIAVAVAAKKQDLKKKFMKKFATIMNKYYQIILNFLI